MGGDESGDGLAMVLLTNVQWPRSSRWACYRGSEFEQVRDPVPINLLIENAPDGVVRRLRQRAERHHRSLQAELLAIIEEAVGRGRELSPAELLAEVRRLGLRTADDAVSIIRADRDLDAEILRP